MPEQQTETVPPVEAAAPPVVTPAPQSQSLPEVAPDLTTNETISDADWDIFNKNKPAPKADVPPVEEKKPEPIKPTGQAQPEAERQQSRPEDKKEPDPAPDSDELPDLDKLDDNIPKNHRALVKQRNKLGKELRLSREKEKGQEEKIRLLEEKAAKANPEKEVEFQKKIDALNADLERTRAEAAEAQDRLYASNVANRPEWQKYVVEPWANAKDQMKALAKRNSFSAEDVWEAYKLPVDQRDQAYSEMLETMNRRDQHTFNAIIDSIPQIVANQKHLELDSKEKRDAFRQREETQKEQERSKRTGTALQTAQSLFEENKKNLPGLFDPQGDTPELKDYRAQIERTRALAEDIAKKGVDSLRPDIQGRMVHDALFADTLRNGFNIVLQNKEKTIGEQTAKIKELEAAVATLQSKVDEYADGTSLVGSSGQRGGVVPNASSDESVGDLVGKFFPNLR